MIAMAFMAPIIFLKNMQMLEKINSLGVLLAMIGLTSIVSSEGHTLIYGSPVPIKDNVAFNFGSTFLFISVSFTAIEGNLTLLPIRAAFEDKKVDID